MLGKAYWIIFLSFATKNVYVQTKNLPEVTKIYSSSAQFARYILYFWIRVHILLCIAYNIQDIVFSIYYIVSSIQYILHNIKYIAQSTKHKVNGIQYKVCVLYSIKYKIKKKYNVFFHNCLMCDHYIRSPLLLIYPKIPIFLLYFFLYTWFYHQDFIQVNLFVVIS